MTIRDYQIKVIKHFRKSLRHRKISKIFGLS